MFNTFYTHIVCQKIECFRNRINIYENLVDDLIFSDFGEYLKDILEIMSIRTLITKMHEYKEKGYLIGEDPIEEYEYFSIEIISKKEFTQELFKEFPVLFNIISKRMDYAVDFFTEIVRYFAQDKDSIEKLLGCEVNKITRILTSGADGHNHGKQVIRVQVDSKTELLYKPRSMECERMHHIFLQWFERKNGIRQKYYNFLSYSDHSWSAIVDYNSCKTEDHLKAYYNRMGVQLFLAYVLGTKDLHQENVIASGEYPVLIDLETLVNIRMNEERKTVSQEVFYRILQSVLYTGLLPNFTWNSLGEGMDLSGISGRGNQKSPFKSLCILEPGTSNMRIGYYYPIIKSASNQVLINGDSVQAVIYKEKIIDGFSAAYNCVLQHKNEFFKLIEPLKKIKNRYVLLDTQRYAMMILTSYHPSLLINDDQRNLFFNYQWKGRMESNKSVIESEIESLKDGDIPYFYYYLNSTSLYTGSGKEIKNYFRHVPYELVIQKIDRLSKRDLEQQLSLIDVSLELSRDDKKRYLNNTHKTKVDALLHVDNCEILKPLILQLKERVLNYAVWNEQYTEVNWYLTRISSGKGYRWNVQPLDMYLYDGLSGMLLLMYGLSVYNDDHKVKETYDAIKKQLFIYTDDLFSQCIKGGSTGAYTGESSIVYAYICMYRLTKNVEYLEYAKRHADALERLLEYDTNYDLLSGNAGAIVVLCLLYSLGEDKRYLQMAIKASEILQQHAVKYPSSIGWKVEHNIEPMSGMAHGNSGILMAFMTLWKYTGDKRYLTMCREILDYEDSLYNFEMRNWMDLRIDKQNFEEENGAIAWCHGVGGILLSRMKCLEMVEDIFLKKILCQDIERASDKLKQYWRRDSWCLCHGICGNLWALGKCENQKYWYHDAIKYLPQEVINPGLMNGYGGVLYYLLSLVNSELPNILTLE